MHKMQVKQKIKEIIASVFVVDVENVPDNCSHGSFDRWDSLGHMNLILALEEEFDIRFSDDEVVDMLNIHLIVDFTLGQLCSHKV